MGQRTVLGTLAILIGLLFIAIAIVYWLEPADALPGFMPGHEAGSIVHHYKHGVLAFVVGLASFIVARFLFGPKGQQV